MQTLKELLKDASEKNIAIGHFNISELGALKAIAAAVKETGMPAIIGTSEGEREFLGTKRAAMLIKSFRDEGIPLYLNADHTHSFDKIKEAVEAGYDAVLFDGGKLPWEENIRQTKEVVAYVKSVNPDILVEGEIGYIGSGSEIITALPEGAAIKPEDLTSAEQALEFVKATGVDLLAPAVGNIHGIIAAKDITEKIDIARVGEISRAANVPLVLHGGSGNTAEDFIAAIQNGVRIVHISTELRVLWRKGVEEALASKHDEVAPYKLLADAIAKMQEKTADYIKLFGKPS